MLLHVERTLLSHISHQLQQTASESQVGKHP